MANEYAVTDNKEALLYRIWKDLGSIAASGGGVASIIGQGRKVVTTAGTPVALAASTAIKSVTIQAEKDNTSDVIIGGSGVVGPLATRQGIFLSPGDTIDFPTDNLANIYIDSLVNGEGVTFIYFI
jgi:hypothetical protein